MRTLLSLLIAVASALADEARILSHDIEIRLDPVAGTFESVDRLIVAGPGRLRMESLPGIAVEGADQELTAGEQEVTLRFRGAFSNAIQKSAAPTWVAGDQTAGVVGPKGSYLTRGFYAPSEQTCLFKVRIRVPLPHRAVSQGRRTFERDADGMHESVYESALPQDGLVVVTGPWKVQEREIGGLSCRTYLYEEDESHAPLLFSTLEAEVPRYQELFGAPVPDGRFDVVSNFFATGYGFANFTLLGDTVIRYVCAKTAAAGQSVLPSGYLDHELVHCWLGNHLLVDYQRGNWCEALTTYCANYGSAVRGGSGGAHRAKVSRSFSLRVTPEKDYPLRAFHAKSHAFENDIGYGKGSMLFDMLARHLGEEKFHAAVRHAIATRGGTKLGWDDLVVALSEGAGTDLKAWFEPWLSRTGGPVLEWGELKVNGTRLSGTILQTQEGEAYALPLTVRVHTTEGTEEHTVFVASKECAFTLPAPLPLLKAELDPDHLVFRTLPRARVAPCLEAVLTAPRRVGFGDAALLARMEIETAIDLPNDAAVLCVGIPEAHAEAVLAAARRQEPTFRKGDGFFEMRGVRYDKPGDGLLLSCTRPEAPGLPLTLYFGNGEAAYARAGYLPYYASDGFVVFQEGRPVARGDYEGDRATRAEISKAREGEPDSLVSTLLLLTDPVHEGRRAGTNLSYQLANRLRGELFRRGLKVVAWPPVLVASARCDGRRLTLGEESREDAFFPMHRTSLRKSEHVFTRVVEHPATDVKGALVLLEENTPNEEVKRYAQEGASVVAVVAASEEMEGRMEEAAWSGAFPPALEARFAKRGGDRELALAGMLARSAGASLSCGYVYVAPSTADAIRKAGAGALTYEVSRSESSTSNVMGIFGEGRDPGVLLSAHWDGVSGAAASDNAAGVAVVLWVAEQLRRDFEAGKLKRPVVVALFGGEEAGLLGSTQFARAVLSPACPIGRPAVAINVDGVGNGGKDEVYLIGRSHAPALLAAFEGALEGTGLALAKDIDAYAFRLGSDHWPLHEAGIPAVTIYNADYRRMNTPGDTLDRVDVANLRKVALATLRMVRKLASE